MKKLIKRTVIILVSILVLVLISSFVMKPKLEPLQNQLATLETFIQHRDSLNENVSEVSVAWHLDHILITINEIYKDMEASEADNYRGKVNLGRLMMFTFNKIPRGRAQSPDRVKPPEVIVTDSIYAHLEKARKSIIELEALDKKAHFTHPFIGMLNKRQSKKFLKIHTNHHLTIIKDILKE